MKFAEATKSHRKSGGAQWRDLLLNLACRRCPPQQLELNVSAKRFHCDRRLEVQSESIERIARGNQDVLASIKHVCFHCIGYLAEMGMP
jgi:hypothetical protein